MPQTPYICSSLISSDQISSPTAAILQTFWPSKQLDDSPGLGLAVDRLFLINPFPAVVGSLRE
eukprot:5043672-Prymnesium_polylepis.1